MFKPYYKPFSLEDFNVSSHDFLNRMRPIYDHLEWDEYDVERGHLENPTRKRAVAETFLEKKQGSWEVRQVQAQPYAQTTDHGKYNRKMPRIYPAPVVDHLLHPEFVKLHQKLADLVSSVRSDVKNLRLILTFLRTVIDGSRAGICALEREPHTDGMEYIVSGLVIHRENLTPDSGLSSVYTPEKIKLYEAALQPGEGIFQDDQHLLHHITDIKRKDPTLPGFRDMLGIDFIINPSR